MAQLDKIRLSGTTYDIIDATAIHSLDGYYTTGETNAAITAATNALAESIAEQNYATTGYVQDAIAEASGVTTGQVQSMIDNSISGKADSSAVTEEISAAVSGKVDTSTYTAYTAATDTALGNKADTTAVTEAISEAVSGKLDTSIFQTYSGDTNTVLASKFAGATWSSNDKKIYFYDNVSATGTALAYIDGTDFVKDGFLSSVTIDNRTISGESVPCLVFIWNTDAGIQETDIPISGIFDPTNYVSVDVFTAYTASTDTVIGGKLDTSVYTAYTAATDTVLGDKADTTAVTQAISEAVSGKADSSSAVTNVTLAEFGNGAKITKTINGASSVVGVINGSDTIKIRRPAGGLSDTVEIVTVSTSAATSGSTALFTSGGAYEALEGKQATLVSGTNIKTVGGNSLLGSGNIAFPAGLTAEVSGTTLIFS